MAYLRTHTNQKGELRGYHLMCLSPQEAALIEALVIQQAGKPWADTPENRLARHPLETLKGVLHVIHHRSLLEKELFIPENDAGCPEDE